MSIFSSRRWALVEMFRGFSQNKTPSLLATVLSALALSVPLFISTIFYEIAEPVRNLPTAAEITVFTDGKVKTDELQSIIEGLPDVTQVTFISKEEAYRSLNDQLGLKSKKNQSNPLPDILIASIRESADSKTVTSTAEEIEKIKGVDMIAYETAWREKLQSLTRAGITTVACLGIIVLALVVLVLMSAVRMTTQTAQTQTQMRALYIFGASPSFALRPLIWRGSFLMLVAAVAALGITELCLRALAAPCADIARLYGIELNFQLPELSWCATFVGLCGLIGYIVAAFAAQDAWRKARR